jgi:hypothetical protein
MCRPANRSGLCQRFSCSPPICNGPGSSSFRGHTVCLLVIAHVSLPTCGVSYSVGRMLTRSFDDAFRHLPQPRRQTSALLIIDQPRSRHTAHVIASTVQGNLPRSFPRHVIPRRNQAKANHVVMKHFLDWPARNA